MWMSVMTRSGPLSRQSRVASSPSPAWKTSKPALLRGNVQGLPDDGHVIHHQDSRLGPFHDLEVHGLDLLHLSGQIDPAPG
jgi:hypothetical protein